MEGLIDALEVFLMRDEEPVVQTHSAAQILASESNDAHLMAPGRISSFNNVIIESHDQLEKADWYTTEYSDLHVPGHLHNHLGEDLMIYDNNHPSNDIHPDNLLMNVNDYLQENDGQNIHDETAWPVLQQAAVHNCNDGHQPQPSTAFLPHIQPDNLLIETTWPLQQQTADYNRHDGHQPQSSTAFLPHIDDNISIDELLINHLHASTSEQPQLLQVQEPQERPSELLEQVGEPVAKQTERRRKGKQVLVVNNGEEQNETLGAAEADAFIYDLVNDDDDDEDNIGDGNDEQQYGRSSLKMKRNVVSERKRRNRLNKQLIALRQLVPSITKMDKRSVLADALAHLKDIHHQIKIEEKRLTISGTADAATADPGHAFEDSPTSSPGSSPEDSPKMNAVNANVEGQPIMPSTVLEPSKPSYSAIFPAITKMEAEKLDEERYILKIVCNKAQGAIVQVQRSVELLKEEFDVVNNIIRRYGRHHQHSATILRVKKVRGSSLVTDTEDLLERVKTTAKQLGLRLPCEA